jgi:cytochrome c-type biogenesis protein CcmH
VTQSAARLIAVLAVVSLAACGGSSAPPPPASSPTPGQSADGLKPLTSRGGAPATSAPGGEAALPAGHPPIGETSRDPDTVTASGSSVSGTITVADALASRVDASDVLYVMAKKDGQTLAVQRIASPAFPLAFEVSEGHAMVAGASLEGPVDIVARLSKTGDAIANAGDLEGTTTGVAVPATGITVTIEQVRQ